MGRTNHWHELLGTRRTLAVLRKILFNQETRDTFTDANERIVVLQQKDDLPSRVESFEGEGLTWTILFLNKEDIKAAKLPVELASDDTLNRADSFHVLSIALQRHARDDLMDLDLVRKCIEKTRGERNGDVQPNARAPPTQGEVQEESEGEDDVMETQADDEEASSVTNTGTNEESRPRKPRDAKASMSIVPSIVAIVGIIGVVVYKGTSRQEFVVPDEVRVPHVAFMQKYFHKGAFFQEAADDAFGTAGPDEQKGIIEETLLAFVVILVMYIAHL